ncbi:hypothetical protein [Paludibacterium purpuratum]|uniref:Uncharacterized protein n=1 Tax=Paludibacterium purpuratum TaxID=1144873 RepID=A0A4R7B653_9NEIS|nr:hypothetical protein [Paludibacterium purpuratum]TDR80150.1 hypothetical protein DFP86_1053 [Paludibacterium purpuratum]
MTCGSLLYFCPGNVAAGDGAVVVFTTLYRRCGYFVVNWQQTMISAKFIKINVLHAFVAILSCGKVMSPMSILYFSNGRFIFRSQTTEV